jgi:hypothetical protein
MARYKHGYIRIRDTAADRPFCRLYYINFIQNYAGGAYGQNYADFINDELSGF